METPEDTQRKRDQRTDQAGHHQLGCARCGALRWQRSGSFRLCCHIRLRLAGIGSSVTAAAVAAAATAATAAPATAAAVAAILSGTRPGPALTFALGANGLMLGGGLPRHWCR